MTQKFRILYIKITCGNFSFHENIRFYYITDSLQLFARNVLHFIKNIKHRLNCSEGKIELINKLTKYDQYLYFDEIQTFETFLNEDWMEVISCWVRCNE